MKKSFVIAAALASIGVAVFAADWPQWRGPDRNGIASQSPALLEEFPKDGLKPLWTSGEIFGGDQGGYGSPTVCAGKAYVYVNHSTPVKWRQLTKQKLAAVGYDAQFPADLSKRVEDARQGDARKGLKESKEINTWVNAWLKENVTADQAKWKELARTRLLAGQGAVAMDVMAAVAPALDRKFDTQADLDAWLKTTTLDDAKKKQAAPLFVTESRDVEDLVYCIDAATGKIDWRTPLEGQFFGFACSPTPAIVGGKVYILSSTARIYCLDAASGKELWKSESFGQASFNHNRSSSVLVAGGVAVALTETNAVGVDIATGNKLWADGKMINQQCSAALWKNGGKDWVIINGSNRLWCVNPADGKPAWNVAPCGGGSTPAIVGDTCVVCAGECIDVATGKPDKSAGIIAYKLSADKADVLWTVPNADTHTGAIISGQYVYMVGNGYQESGNGLAKCLSLKDGTTVWSEKIGAAQLASPVLADGKIIAVNGSDLVVFKADPAKYSLVGKASLQLDRWTSPAIADGKLFLRTGKGVICVDLRKQ